MIDRFKNSSLETIFLLSPCFIAWGWIFNFPDVKHILSKLVSIIGIYCIIFYREDLMIKVKNNSYSLFLFFLSIVGLYFSFLHYYNDGHFDFARAVFACLFYFLLVPKHVFNIRNLSIIISFSSVMTISKGVYDSSVLGEIRIGKIVNPGPYAYVCSLLLITQMSFFVSEFKRKLYPLMLCHGLISIFLVYIIYLTGTRSAWLGLLLISIYFVFYIFKNKGSVRSLVFGIVFGILTISFSNVKFIHDRIARSVAELNMMMEGNYNTSSGARIDMWKNGIVIGSNNFIFGVSRSLEIDTVKKLYAQKDLQLSAYRILNHSRSSYHNVYIQSLVKGGLIALFLMLVWVSMPIVFSKSDVLNISIPITIMTVICSGFESQFTIYSACAYFYLLLVGYLILLDRSNDSSEV